MLSPHVESLVEQIERQFKPLSIFLYGSRARNDYLPTSDYEIGIIYEKENKIYRRDLWSLKKGYDVVIYPFELEEIKNQTLDTPFPKAIYMRELILSGKTIRGEKVIEELPPPSIMTIDLISSLEFELGIVLSATVFSFRNNDVGGSRVGFYKSCLYGLRTLEIFLLKKFPLGYKEIIDFAKEIDLGKYENLVKTAWDVRNGAEITEDILYENISFLNQFVLKKLVEDFNKKGNSIYLP